MSEETVASKRMPPLFPQLPVPLRLDPSLVASLRSDLEEHGGVHAPSAAWDLLEREDTAGDPYGTIQWPDMVRMWIGSRALVRPNPAELSGYLEFFEQMPLVGELARADLADLRTFELGTLVDCAIIAAHVHLADRPLTIVEIGAGFGRLTEALARMMKHDTRFVLVDAVPESIAGAYAYLSERLPGRSVEVHGSGSSDASVLLVPAWRWNDAMVASGVDLFCSVAAMQEMTDEQVRHYTDLINRNAKVGTRVYLCHSRDYVYPRDYDYPASWSLVYKSSTPRSYSPDYPAEVFVVGGVKDSLKEASLIARYTEETRKRYQVAYSNIRRESARSKRELTARLQSLRRHHNQVAAGWRRRNETLRATLLAQRQRADRLARSVKSMRTGIETLRGRLSAQTQRAARLAQNVELMRARIATLRSRLSAQGQRAGRLAQRVESMRRDREKWRARAMATRHRQATDADTEELP